MAERRRLDPADLLRAAEVTELLGVGRKPISGQLARGKMPASLPRLQGGPPWRRADWEAWMARRAEGREGARRSRRDGAATPAGQTRIRDVIDHSPTG